MMTEEVQDWLTGIARALAQIGAMGADQKSLEEIRALVLAHGDMMKAAQEAQEAIMGADQKSPVNKPMPTPIDNPDYFRYPQPTLIGGQAPATEQQTPVTASELEDKANAYAVDMMKELDAFNAQFSLPQGELVSTLPDRGDLITQYKQFFYEYIWKQRGVAPEKNSPIFTRFAAKP